MYELPIFPLNTVLFPGMPLSLVIFEDRYKLMLQKVMKTNRTFGVNLIRRGQEAHGPLPEPYTVGCTARIIQVEAHDNSTYQLTAIGDERYRILRLGEGEPYLSGFVESIPLEKPHSLDVVRGSQVLRARVGEYLTLLAEFISHEPDDAEINLDLTQLQLPDDALMLIYMATALLQIPAHEKQPLLEAETASRLLKKVLRLFRRELAVLPGLLHIDDDQASQLAQSN
jgi:uncharacterized protein